MSRPLIVIALIVAIVAAIFFFSKVGLDFLTVLILAAIVLLAAGIITGR